MITAITKVWSDIMAWIVESLGSVQEVFYVVGENGTGNLTFLGTLAVIGVAIAIVFLVIGVVQNFLRLRS